MDTNMDDLYYTHDAVNGVTYNGLPVLVADDDFIEHLHEHGFDKTIELDELWVEYEDWAAENVE
jgi:hypothetical protein